MILAPHWPIPLHCPPKRACRRMPIIFLILLTILILLLIIITVNNNNNIIIIISDLSQIRTPRRLLRTMRLDGRIRPVGLGRSTRRIPGLIYMGGMDWDWLVHRMSGMSLMRAACSTTRRPRHPTCKVRVGGETPKQALMADDNLRACSADLVALRS
jgi:hypothetical protein